jgi:hypothetical protein
MKKSDVLGFLFLIVLVISLLFYNKHSDCENEKNSIQV